MATCKANTNPFFYGRYEHERSQVYYVNDNIVEWAGLKPIRFEGVRGCGKSSTLKLLSWDITWNETDVEILGSPSVRKFIKQPKHIGVYYKVEDLVSPLWDRWNVSKDISQKYFGTYLDFLYLDLLLDAMDRIRKITSLLFTDRQAEINLTKKMLKICFPDIKNRPRLINLSFAALRDIIADIHYGIRHLVLNDTSKEIIEKTYAVVSPGSVIKEFGNEFQRQYPDLKDWNILILLDDCNFLTYWQTVIVNTMVTNCTAPISYKLSSLVGMYPTVDTLDKDKPLIADNIDIEPLPTKKNIYMTAKMQSSSGIQYSTFANYICKARIKSFCGEIYSKNFDFKKYLGLFELEDLLAQKLKESENPDALDLLEEAKSNMTEQKHPTITETWLNKKQVRDTKKIANSSQKYAKLSKRKISSQYIKKWNHVAGISLCKEFQLDFPYCSFHVVLHLSSDSIREMLRIMSMIWDAAGGKTDSFFGKYPIDQRIQLLGIKNAAESHFNIIDSNPINKSGSSLQRICERLGKLFSKCQTYPFILTTPETASLSISKSIIDDDIDDIIRKAVVSGWMLKKTEEDGKRYFIGLHPILSPKFKISFRSPFYYPEPVSDKKTLRDLFLGSDKEAKKAQKSILKNRIERYETRHCKKASLQKNLFQND